MDRFYVSEGRAGKILFLDTREMTKLIDLHAPRPGPRDRRLRAGRPDRRSGPLVVPGGPARTASRASRGRSCSPTSTSTTPAPRARSSRFPKLRVYVHEVGAPHLVDPAKLLRERTPAVRRRHGAPLGRGGGGAGLQRRRPRAGESGSRAFGSPTPRATRATTSPTSMSRAAMPTSATWPACASLRSSSRSRRRRRRTSTWRRGSARWRRSPSGARNDSA